MRVLSVVLLLALVGPAAAAAGRPVLLVGEGVSADEAAALADEAGRAGVELTTAREPRAPAIAEAMEEARRLFREMDFQRAALRLSAAEANLIEGRTPSPALVAAVVDLETWLGACLLFAKNGPDAAERFALVHALDPNAKPDPVLPPEVARAFARLASPAPISVRARVAPPDARLWIDGKPATTPLALRPGLHWVVGERADRRPLARMVRVSASLPEISVSLADVASRPEALEQAARQARRGSLGREESAAVAALAGSPVWLVSVRDGHVAATRSSPDPAEEPSTVPLSRVADAARVSCRAEHACADEQKLLAVPTSAPTGNNAVTSRATAPARPVWKRGWFWAVVVGAALVAGGVTGGVVAATTPRDYAARF